MHGKPKDVFSWIRGAFGYRVSCVTAIVTFASLAFADDPWPSFRGPSGDGKAGRSATAPLLWSADENVKWRTKLPGEGWSSPVIGEEAIYLTAAVEDPADLGAKMLVLLAIDPQNGKVLNQVDVFAQPAEAPQIHSKNSHASPTPWLTGDRIFVHFGHQGTAAISREGEKLWTNRELTFPPVHGNGGSPILVGDVLIFSCDGGDQAYVAALDADTGKLRWRTDRPVNADRKFSFCTPTAITVNQEVQVICPGSDCALALDPSDGKILWQVNYDGYSVVPKPVYADGLVLIGTGFGPTAVMAIDPTGRGNVTDSHVRWTLDKGAPKTPSLLAHDGLLYVTSDDGILTVVETKTGEQVYRKRIGGNYSASPMLVGDRIYLTSEEGLVKVIQTGPEFQLLAENSMDERILATPAALDKSLIIRTEQALYRIE